MFGYIAVNKPELKIREFDRYRAWYCGLCHALKSRAGRVGQVTLTYDITFLYILLSALYEPETEEVQARCVVHPVKKHAELRNALAAYAADMNLLMAYYQAEDDWQDDKNAIKGLLAKSGKGQAARIRETYPAKCAAIEAAMKEVAAGEAAGDVPFDEMASRFGRVLAEVFAYRKDEWEEALRRMGFFLGKFVWILDAAEDLRADVKSGAYNPFKGREEDPAFPEDIGQALQMMMAECAQAFEYLPIVEETGILRNVLYAGVWDRYAAWRGEWAGSGPDEPKEP